MTRESPERAQQEDSWGRKCAERRIRPV